MIIYPDRVDAIRNNDDFVVIFGNRVLGFITKRSRNNYSALVNHLGGFRPWYDNTDLSFHTLQQAIDAILFFINSGGIDYTGQFHPHDVDRRVCTP